MGAGAAGPRAALAFQPLRPETLAACAAICATAPDPWTELNLQTAMDDERRRTFVALLEGRAAAFACFLCLADNADLETLAVHPSLRRRGIARALLKHALPALAAAGATRCLLEARQSNAAAIGLYTSLGFKTLGPRPGMYQNPREDGVLMGLALNDTHP